MKLFKDFYSIIFFLAFFVTITEAQKLENEKPHLTFTNTESKERCGADQYIIEYLSDPKNAAEYKALQIKVANELENMKGQATCVNPLIIPVAIHYNSPITTANTQCLIDVAQAQIEQLNLDFSGCNANAGLLCDWIMAGCDNFGGAAGADAVPDDGACIQFCIGDQNLPVGEDNIGGLAITVGDYTWPGASGYPWDDWLNIFVGTATSGPAAGNLGVATPLGGLIPNGGVYVFNSAFGSQTFNGCTSGGLLDDSGATYGGGAILTHEVGHFFGLDHTFNDNLADTPPQNNPNFGCPTVNTTTCTATGCQETCDNYTGNFMDYAEDDCSFTFTQDQVDVMLATVANQNQWDTGSVSCAATNYPACGEANQVGACISAACANVNLDILFDNFPGQTSWNIVDASGTIVASGSNYGSLPGNSTTTESTCLPDGCYTLQVNDAFNNGMCPFQSSAEGVATFVTPGTLITPGSIVGTLSLVANPGLCGNYTLTDGAGGVLASGGGEFGASQSNQFCLAGGLAPRLHQSSTNEIKKISQASLEVLPSIAANFITINYNINMQNAQLRIVDVSGKVLQQYNREHNLLPSLKIDITEFKTGIKFVQLISAGGEVITRKFLKQ